jgi:hypothetical protein
MSKMEGNGMVPPPPYPQPYGPPDPNLQPQYGYPPGAALPQPMMYPPQPYPMPYAAPAPVIINNQMQQQQQQVQQIIVRRGTNHALCCIICLLTGGINIPCWIYACVTEN